MKKIILFLLLTTAITNAQIVNIPDTNFKAKLIQLGYDANSDGEIQLSEATTVSTLNISNSNISSIVGIEAFTNLTELYCYNNNLIEINLIGLSQLSIINFSNNQVQIFDATSLTSLTQIECQYNQLVALNVNGLQNLIQIFCDNNLLTNIDFSGLSELISIYANNNLITNLNIQNFPNLSYIEFYSNLIINATIVNCNSLSSVILDNNQLQTISLQNLPNLNYLGCSFNLLTSLNLVGLNNLEYLSCSNNLLANLDFINTPNIRRLHCSNNNFSILDFSNNLNFEYLSCASNPNLTNINIKNGKEQFINFEFANDWSNCPNLIHVCADENEITTVQTILFVSNLINVNYNTYCSFTPGGNYNTINGMVQFDADSNGCDVNDGGMPNVRININDGTNQGAAFTNVNGSYAFYTQSGSFAVTPAVENPLWFNFSPTTASIPFANNNNNLTTQNFCLTANGVHPDVEMVIVPITSARPGFDAVYKLVYRNRGNQTVQAFINFAYNDAVLDFVSSSVVPNGNANGAMSWIIASLQPFQSGSIEIVLNVNSPMEIPAVNNGNILAFTSYIHITVDDNLADNAFTLNQTVVGSYDPNDITCLEGAIVSPAAIGNYLHYNIRFENTGTAAAENVIVKVAVNPLDFDVNTLQVKNTSHPVDARIRGTIVEFIFQNIMLDSGGHGNVLLKMRTKSNLQQGDLVNKRAAIYFDYNFPIDTNDAETLFQSLNNPSFEQDTSINIYPNPARSIINIKSNFNIKTIELYDVQGRLLQTDLVNNSATSLDISSKAKGIYFIKITSAKGIKVEKLVKE